MCVGGGGRIDLTNTVYVHNDDSGVCCPGRCPKNVFATHGSKDGRLSAVLFRQEGRVKGREKEGIPPPDMLETERGRYRSRQ